MKNTFSSLAVTCALICCVLPWPRTAVALQLPAGDEIAALAWQNDQQLVLVVTEGEHYALRRLDFASGEFTVIAAPLSFTKISTGASGSQPPELALAPSGTALAVLERSDTPLEPPDLSLYRIAEDGLEQVNTSGLPADFWPDQLAWSADGESLYMAARCFLFPEQSYSIGRLELGSERFAGVALKANVDLISALAFIPQRGGLIAFCGGFQGEYPEQPMIALIPSTGAAQLLHSQAAGHWLNVLANGSVLIGADDGAGEGELWLLSRTASQLTPAQCAFPESARMLQTNRDGSWMGFIISGGQLDLPARNGGSYLVLQRTNDGKTVVTADSCSAFSFAPAGKQICAVDMNGTTVQFYSLPD